MSETYSWLNANPAMMTALATLVIAVAYYVHSAADRRAVHVVAVKADKAAAAAVSAVRSGQAAAASADKAVTAIGVTTDLVADQGKAVLETVQKTHDAFNGNVKLLLDRIAKLESKVENLAGEKAVLTAANVKLTADAASNGVPVAPGNVELVVERQTIQASAQAVPAKEPEKWPGE